jgi:exodeoxyribonuclease III
MGRGIATNGRRCYPAVLVRIGTWNVNGIRARHGEVVAWAAAEKLDVFCLQEIRATTDQVPDALIGLADYHNYWHGGPKGYAGVSLHVRKEVCAVCPAFVHPSFDVESRIVSAELPGDRVVASVYVHNGNKNYEAKKKFLEAMKVWAGELRETGKALILCGDLNVARTDRDVHPKLVKAGTIGQLPEEREMLEAFFAHGKLIDAGRALRPDDDRLFTWWPPWRESRKRNIGWRLDYVCVSEPLFARVRSCEVVTEYGTSDHGPVIAAIDDVRAGAAATSP